MSFSVKRVLHPVGHGAFFTEQFFADRRNVFNVVYDCGVVYDSLSNLYEEIDNTFAKSTKSFVDYIFISHLDEDHVNGIEYMIRSGYVTKETSFVLPFIAEKYLSIYRTIENENAHFGLEVIRRSPAGKIYYIMPYSHLEKGDVDRIIRIDLDGNDERNGNREVSLPSGTKFVYDKIWEYIPFNLHDSASKEFMDAIEDSKVLDSSDLTHIESIIFGKLILPNFEVTEELRKAIEKYDELKRIYNSVGPRRKGDRKININSLLVISQGIRDFRSTFYLITIPSIPEAFTKTVSGKGSGVYTGDMNLKDDKDFALFLQILARWMKDGNEKSLVQIPHHGSSTSYNSGFATVDFGICFVNFNSTKTHLDQNIRHDFFCARKPLIAVTEIESSRFVERMYLK